MKKLRILLTPALLLLIVLIATSAKKYIGCALDGISAWAFNVLPCTLPFMMLTKLVIELGEMEKLTRPFSQPFKALYGTSPSAGYVFFMSILAGYPVGSKMTADLYESGKISKTEAFRMCSFCSNSGPMFIVGTVGALLLKNAAVGGILFVSHALSALLNGLLYRKIKAKEEAETPGEKTIEKTPLSFGDIVLSSVQSVLSVGAIICLFFIIIEAAMPLLSLLPAPLLPLGEGLIELTRGCIDASALSLYPAAVICSFLISFGGFSTILQSMAMLKKLKMPAWLFSVFKLTQGLISAAITAALMFIVV